MKHINSFLWLCAGANKSLLKRCPTEGAKFAGIGATILFTGIFAAFAGGYAIHTVFSNIYATGFFALLWGLMIFNLDRYIVSSMKKRNNIRSEVYLSIPRIVLALIIAMVISKPLELKLFEKEINAELQIMQQETYKLQEEGIKVRYSGEIAALRIEIDELNQQIADKTITRDQLEEQARQEADGTGGSMQRNLGPIYKLKKADADKLNTELNEMIAELTPLIQDKNQRINVLQKQIDNEINSLDRASINGLAAQIEALSRLKSKSSAIMWTEWFLFLLFIALETAPIFVKLISSRGPYDELLEGHEHKFKVRGASLIANQSDEVRKSNQHLRDPEMSYLEEKLLSSTK